MAETLGSLCDKLTIIKLKQWHSDNSERLQSLADQERQLQEEITRYVADAIFGEIPLERLTFVANKVYKKEGNPIADVQGTVGLIFSRLADVNCRLWHVQEKVYEFETIPVDQKNDVVKRLAILNLERTQCIDQIDKTFRDGIVAAREKL